MNAVGSRTDTNKKGEVCKYTQHWRMEIHNSINYFFFLHYKSKKRKEKGNIITSFMSVMFYFDNMRFTFHVSYIDIYSWDIDKRVVFC